MDSPCRLLFVLVPLVFASCGDSGREKAWWDAGRERVELANRLELANYRYQQLGGNDTAVALGRVQREKAALRSRLELARAQVVRLKTETAALSGDLKLARESKKKELRARMVGAGFESLRAGSGRIYHEVSVATVDDAGVTIRHRDGSARLGWSDLDPQQRDMFALDERTARAAEEEERRQALAYEKWLDEELRLRNQREREVVKASAPARPKPATPPALANARPVLANNPLREPARKMASYSPRVRRSSPTYYYYSTYPSCYPTIRSFAASQYNQMAPGRPNPVVPVTPAPVCPPNP